MRLQMIKVKEYTKVLLLPNLGCEWAARKTTKVHNLRKNRKFRLLQPLHGQGYALFGGVYAQNFDAHNIAHLQSLARVLDKFVADL